jgi:hypothetical protein
MRKLRSIDDIRRLLNSLEDQLGRGFSNQGLERALAEVNQAITLLQHLEHNLTSPSPIATLPSPALSSLPPPPPTISTITNPPPNLTAFPGPRDLPMPRTNPTLPNNLTTSAAAEVTNNIDNNAALQNTVNANNANANNANANNVNANNANNVNAPILVSDPSNESSLNTELTLDVDF